MKKIFYFAAIAGLALSSCSKQEYLGEVQHAADNASILFSSEAKPLTKADRTGAAAATLLGNNFVVEGIKGNGTFSSYAATNVVFDHYNVNYTAFTANTTESNTADWEYVGQTKHALSAASAQTIKYWDYGAAQYDFVAFSYGTATDKTNTSDPVFSAVSYTNIGKAVSTGTPVYTVLGRAEELAKVYIADLVTVYNQSGVSEYGTTITPKFRSLGTKVRVAFYETVPGYSVKNLKFYSSAWDGSETSAAGADDATLFAANAIFPGNTTAGTMSIYYPTVGFAKRPGGTAPDDDYNQAHIKFAAGTGTQALEKTKTFGALANMAAAEGSETAGNIYLGRTSNTATYAGDVTAADHAYQIVLPLGTKDNLQIRVEYDLVPTDGASEVIHVRDARAMVPEAYADWKPNYAYTYIFKISDATNGWTGVDGSGTVVEGLTPITFDAVVVDTEDGVQETITTVTTPSITTYQMGKVVTTGSEYAAGDVYVTAVDGTTAKNSPITLYQVSQAVSGALISEATCELAYNMGKTDPSSDVYDKTNIYLTQLYGGTTVTSVPSADGNTLAVPAFKFTAISGLTYVVRYDGGTGKVAYKVIKVQ